MSGALALAGKFRLGYRNFALTLPAPCISESCIKIKILLCGASGGIMVGGPLALSGLWMAFVAAFAVLGLGMALSRGACGLCPKSRA